MRRAAAVVGPAEALGFGVAQSSQQAWTILILVAALVTIYSALPLGTALELGGDEGFELTKGFLCSKGFVLYKQIWNDQPPLFSKLLGWAFEMFGPSILVARIVAVGFGLLLFSAFYQLVRQRSGAWAALAAAFFLLGSPGVLQLSASVMLEVPAIATGLLSAWLVFQWTKREHSDRGPVALRRERWHWAWLVASGTVMGLALQIKLTAVVVAPAILAEIFVAAWARRREEASAPEAEGRREKAEPPSPKRFVASRSRKQPRMLSGFKAELDESLLTSAATILRSVLSGVAIWGAAATVIFLAIGFMWGGGSLASSWKSHTVTLHVPGLSSPGDFRFEPTLLMRHPECLVGAIAGVVLLSRQRRWRELVFPVVMLFTGLVIHAVHRPWWPYYYLHLAVPLAWLSGLAVSEVLRGTAHVFSAAKSRASSPARWKWIGACVVAAFGVAVAEARLESSFKKIRQSPRASDSLVLAKMKEYAGRTRWAYCQPVIYPFHARLAVPPELAVVVLKRYWSGQITPKEIVEVCSRYKPEQVLLYASRFGSEWRDMFNGYRPVYQDTNYVLYVSRLIQDK